MFPLPSFHELRPVFEALHDGDVPDAVRRYKAIGPSHATGAEQAVEALEGIRQALRRCDKAGAIGIYQNFADAGFDDARAVVDALEPKLFAAPSPRGKFGKWCRRLQRKPQRTKLQWILALHALALMCVLGVVLGQLIGWLGGGSHAEALPRSIWFLAVFSGVSMVLGMRRLRTMAKRPTP